MCFYGEDVESSHNIAAEVHSSIQNRDFTANDPSNGDQMGPKKVGLEAQNDCLSFQECVFVLSVQEGPTFAPQIDPTRRIFEHARHG